MEGLKRDNEMYIPLSDNITISINSSDEFVATESESESKSRSNYLSYEEELPNQNKDKLSRNKEKIKNFQNISGNQKENINFSSSQQSYLPSSLLNLINEKNFESNNTYSELDYGYKELDKLMSKYAFLDAAKIILKIHNGIPEDNDENNDLYQKLKSISSVIKNKNNLTLMCLGILSSKIQFKKDEEPENKISNKIRMKKPKKIKMKKRKFLNLLRKLKSIVKLNIYLEITFIC